MIELTKDILVKIEQIENELIEDKWSEASKEVSNIIIQLSKLVEWLVQKRKMLPEGLLEVIDALIKSVQLKDCIQIADLLSYDLKDILVEIK